MTLDAIRLRGPGARRLPGLGLLGVLALAGVLAAISSKGSEKAAGPVPRPSLLIVTVDSLRFDGGDATAYGAPGAIPAWLEKRGVHFTTAISGGDWTIPSFLAMLSGRYPSESGVVGGTTELSPAGPLLAEILRKSGYATSAVLSNPNLGLSGYGLKRGFDTYDATNSGSLNRAEGKPNFGARNAAEITADSLKALRALQQQGRPWFLWIHYFEPHGPYYVPPDFPRIASEPGEPLPLAQGDLPEPGTLPA